MSFTYLPPELFFIARQKQMAAILMLCAANL